MSLQQIQAKIDLMNFADKIDQEKALKKFNMLKHRKIEEDKSREMRWRDEQERKEAIKAAWGYEGFKNAIKDYYEAKNGNLDIRNLNYIKRLCAFLSRDSDKMAEFGLDSKKGL